MLLFRIKRINYRHLIPDVILIMSSLYASLYLRVGWDDGYAEFLPVLNRHILLCLILRIGCFFVLGIYDIIWRYISFSDALRLFQAIGLSSVLIIASSYLVELERLPRAVFLIDAILAAILLGGIRFVRRFVFEVSTEAEVRRLGRKTLIYGAGFGGRTLASRFNTDSKMGFSLVGFIDDDPQKVGRSVAGVKVLGTRKEFAEIFKAFQIKELIVAISQISGSVLREILPVCRSFGIGRD